MRITRGLAAVAVGIGLTVAGCGGDDSNGGGSDQAEFNGADIAFAQGMIPHHEQAIEMAELARERASEPDVVALAGDIEAAQGPEIETMQSWLDDWGVAGNEDGMMDNDGDMGHDMDGMDDMNGMMSDQQMSQLESVPGDEFDRLFLTMMIEHHEGAIEMAQTEQRDGENPDAVELAEQIESAQTREIDLMESMLEQQ